VALFMKHGRKGGLCLCKVGELPLEFIF
jgi:hypothetical protein